MKNTKETQKETWQAPEITDLDVKKDTEGKKILELFNLFKLGALK